MRNRIQEMIASAAKAAKEMATTVANEAAKKAAVEADRIEKEAAMFASEAEKVAPRKSDLLEKEGKLEKTINRLLGKLEETHDKCGRGADKLQSIERWTKESNFMKMELGTSIVANSYKMAKAHLEAKGFKEGTRSFNELKGAMMEKFISTVPEISALVAEKERMSAKVEAVKAARLRVEEGLYKEGKRLQWIIQALEVLDVQVAVNDPLVLSVLQELPLYGKWKFDFKRKYVVFAVKVKAIKDKVKASSLAKGAAKVAALKEVANEEAFYKDAVPENIISLAEAKELKALADAARRSGNTVKPLTVKTIEKARKLAQK